MDTNANTNADPNINTDANTNADPNANTNANTEWMCLKCNTPRSTNILLKRIPNLICIEKDYPIDNSLVKTISHMRYTKLVDITTLSEIEKENIKEAKIGDIYQLEDGNYWIAEEIFLETNSEECFRKLMEKYSLKLVRTCSSWFALKPENFLGILKCDNPVETTLLLNKEAGVITVEPKFYAEAIKL